MGTPVTLVDAGGAPVTLTDPQGGAIPLGSMAPQDANAVAITGGSITGITDLAIADGGTGASTAAAARSALGLYGVGAAFPGSPVADDLFYRTDRDLMYFFDGTRWLTLQQFSDNFYPSLTSASNISAYAPIPDVGGGGVWLVALDTSMLRTTALPDEWDIELQWLSSGAISTVITTVDGSADPQNTCVARTTAIGAVLDSNARMLRLQYLERDDGGSLVAAARIRWRLIG